MYFKKLKTPEEIKSRYFDLAKKHHPDCGGDVQTMQRINAEFADALAAAQNSASAAGSAADAESEFAAVDLSGRYIDVLNVIFSIPNIDVELCGSWLWISGDTYPARDALRAARCRWSSSKKKWYWRPDDGCTSTRRGSFSMDQIRSKYGSQNLSGTGSVRIPAHSAALPSA